MPWTYVFEASSTVLVIQTDGRVNSAKDGLVLLPVVSTSNSVSSTIDIDKLIEDIPTAHSHPHYALKKYAFYNKMYILRIIAGFL